MAPAGVLWLCRKVKWLEKIGPVLILYILGLIIGNSGIMKEEMSSVQNILSNAMVPLAIPLMLFGCSIKKVGNRSHILALITGIISVTTAVVVGFLLLGSHIPDGSKVGGMLTGVYTGGTINLAALKTMLGVSEETYIIINSYDILVSFLYLAFLLTFGIRLCRRILPGKTETFTSDDKNAINTEINKVSDNPYSGLFSRSGLKQAATLLGLTILIVGLSAGGALLLPEGMFMTAFILLLTTGGIAFSFIGNVRKMKYSYDIGMYFIYIFCITVASMADLSKLDFSCSLWLLAYLLIAVFGSLLLQIIFAKIFRIDADTMVISSVTFINSPPFVPMMAAAMKNRNVLVPGLAIGVIGYAIGNYLGFIVSQLLGIL